MNPTKEDRAKRYRVAPELVQNLYASPEYGEIYFNVAKKHGVETDDLYTFFINIIGDVILGFKRKFEIGILFQTVLNKPPEQTEIMIKDLGEILTKIPEFIDWEKIKESEKQKSIEAAEKLLESSKIIKFPEEPGVAPLRTMEMDAKKVHGYGAFQSYSEDRTEVHKSSQEHIMAPNYNKPNSPDSSSINTNPTHSE